MPITENRLARARGRILTLRETLSKADAALQRGEIPPLPDRDDITDAKTKLDNAFQALLDP